MAASKKQRRKPAAKIRRTFESAGKAASEFYAENSAFFDGVRDTKDGTRDFLSGMDSPSGKRLTDTSTGARILGKRNGRPQLVAVLTYIFGRAKGRRWEDVDWSEIQRLEASLSPYYEPYGSGSPQIGALTWRPLAVITPEEVGALSAEQASLYYAHQAQTSISESLARLRSAYERNKGCLLPAQKRHVKARIREWEKWRSDPSKVPAYACDPDPTTGGMTCDYPVIDGELQQLSKACRDGYDPRWDSLLAGEPGFPAALEAGERPAIPIEAFDEEAPEPCSVNDAAGVLGRHSARKRAQGRKKRSPKYGVVMGRMVKM